MLLVTFDLWLSCVWVFFSCVCLFGFFVVVVLFFLFFFFFFCRCCGGFASAGLLDLGWAGVPGRAYSTGVWETACWLTFCTCPFPCHGVPLSLGFACGSTAWVGVVAEAVKLGVVLGPQCCFRIHHLCGCPWGCVLPVPGCLPPGLSFVPLGFNWGLG